MRLKNGPLVVLVGSCLGLLLPAAMAVAQQTIQQRVAWKYLGTKDQQVQIFRHKKEVQWALERSDGTVTGFTELSRDDDQIIVQNNDTKLIIRLTAGRGYWRRPADAVDDWKTWVKGEWIDPASLPRPVSASRQYVVKVAYFVPQDRQPQRDYDRKIRVVMQYVAQLYRSDLQQKRLPSDGFQLELEEDNQRRVHLVRGERAAGYYNNAPAYDANEQWRRVVPEIRNYFADADRQVIVVFTETYDDGPAEFAWPGVIARGAYYHAESGMAMFSAHLLRDEFCALTIEAQKAKFFDPRPVPGRRALGHQMNSARSEFTEDGFGAVAHELGHAFGLPHDRRRDDLYIMGNGFRNLRQNFNTSTARWARFSNENASLLMSSRYLNPNLDHQDNTPADVEMTLEAAGSNLLADLTARDEGGIRAVVFSDMVAGTIIAGTALDATELTERVRLPRVEVRNGEVEIRVIVTDSGGNQTRVTKKLKVR